jgi:hypothetical protein
MALVKCNGCSAVISSRAGRCPRCGSPTASRLFEAIIAFGSLVMLVPVAGVLLLPGLRAPLINLYEMVASLLLAR